MSTEREKMTFFSKEEIKCLVCGAIFNKEELRTGGGRLIAENLGQDLRMNYKKTEKYGRVTQIVYNFITCPNCLFSSFPHDFGEVPRHIADNLKKTSEARKEKLQEITDFDFTQKRTLHEAFISYYSAVICYQNWPLKFAPTIKQGVSCLRAGWCCDFLNEEYPNENWDYMRDVFYTKARFFYRLALEKEEKQDEILSLAGYLGPDTDKNWGFDGVLYLATYLEYKYGQKKDKNKRLETLETFKNSISKIFGMGKKSVSKPGPLLDKVKDLYDDIKKELKI